jgi:membrane peptidoglycan carboxypeptidase
VVLVWQLSRQLSRPKIVELALNYGHYGGLLFGCEAAARDHFGIPARQLTAGQAALLVRSCGTGAGRPAQAAAPGARTECAVLKAMAGSGFLTAGQAHQLCLDRRPSPAKLTAS